MSQTFLDIVRQKEPEEIAAVVDAQPELVRSRDLSTESVYAGEIKSFDDVEVFNALAVLDSAPSDIYKPLLGAHHRKQLHRSENCPHFGYRM